MFSRPQVTIVASQPPAPSADKIFTSCHRDINDGKSHRINGKPGGGASSIRDARTTHPPSKLGQPEAGEGHRGRAMKRLRHD
jgi:hypothetical protein